MTTLATTKIPATDPSLAKNSASPKVDRQPGPENKPNRLIHEKSPYLLQHAYNPVAWYPWSDEAFRTAQKENKLIFLSIGYSTCHWCHVMARECFENPKIAEFLNRYFICIKVDREERPDIDQIYMQATLALNGSGGWPMSVFLLPDLQPFFAGTYFPPESRPGQLGFLEILSFIQQNWTDTPDKLKRITAEVALQLKQPAYIQTDVAEPAEKILKRAMQQLSNHYDQVFGGFGKAPKFPSSATNSFLLRYFARYHSEQALTMATTTLQKMAMGGIYDQLGGGFHRYSVDSQWRTPHFEKMLYDQAQLATAYLEAFQVTNQPHFATTARGILDYVLRDMTASTGGFYSAEDADSTSTFDPTKHGEGLYYTWTAGELATLLNNKQAYELVCYHFGITDQGNALADLQGELAGLNILHVSRSLENTANHFNLSLPETTAIINNATHKMFVARNQRPRPHLDDKIITAWNGLMISALVRGYQVLDDPRYLAAGRNAAMFIRNTLYSPDTRILQRRFRDGSAGIAGFLVDYAFFTQALLDLFETTFEVDWLTLAIDLTEAQLTLFDDPATGIFFDTSGMDSNLKIRTKSDYDGPEPTGGSIAALNLLRLAQLTDNRKWRDRADLLLAAYNRRIAENPLAMLQLLAALDFQLEKPRQIIIAGTAEAEDTKKMLHEAHKIFLPSRIILLADNRPSPTKLSDLLPFLSFMTPINGKATAYICKNYTCQLPTTDITEMIRQLRN